MSTALNLIAPAAAAASAGERADELRLLAAVAAAIVRGAIAANPREQALFAIGDLPPDQTSAMALAVAEVPGAEVHVHPERSDGSLPPALLSRATAAHWRNMRRSDGPGAIVYAVPTRDAETVGTTVATIVPLATDTLLERPELWVEAIGRPIDERQKDWLVEALRGVVAANLALDLPMFARFVRRFFRHYADENVPAHRALAAALPALRLPSGAGSFKEAGKRGRVQSAARWRAELEEIRQKAEDRLYLRTDRGGRLPVEALKERVAQLEAEGGLDAAEARVVRDFLDHGPVEPGIWAPEQAAVCELPWDKVEPVFTRGSARKEPLGKATADFFAKMFPTRLTGEEREDLLPRVTRENREPLEDERDFFFRHKDELLADKKLYARWEKFVFKGNEQHEDLLAGLFRGITDLLRTTPERPADPRLYVRLPEADGLRFWEKRNISLCCYLRDRYRGLDRLLAAEGIVLDFGLCWAGDWEASLEGRRETSTKKQAREFKIEIYLLGAADLPAGGRPDAAALRAAPKGQIVWLPPGEALLATFTHDLHEIALLTTAEPLVALTGGRFSRNPKADRALDRAIRLDDRNSILDAYDESEGNLVNTERDDLGVELARSLVDLEARGVLPRDVAARLRERLQAFHQAYSAALRGLLEPQGLGLADEALLIQAERYGELLEALRATARVDECRSRLWAPALSIGIAMSGDTPPAAIVAPWQPLRLAELAVKARQAAATCGMALRSGFEGNADAEIFFEAKATALGTSFYPEVCLHASRKGGAWGGFRLLAETAALGGYGLCEPPTVDQGADGLFEGFPKEAVDAFMQVADEYLALQPHERANFSTVLLNAEARGLPGALAERLARKIERESDLRCDLVMTHTDRARLREIYEQQNTAIGREIDSALASEATRTFLSRLRVGILDVSAGNGAAAARQADLVLMQDVVARSARTGWRPASGGTFPSLAGHDPTSGSRRCPYDKGALSSAVHLAAPRQPRGVQAYLDLLHDLLTNDRTEGAHHWVPVREVAFTDPTVRNVLDTAHAVGEWVFSYDAIADRRLSSPAVPEPSGAGHLPAPLRRYIEAYAAEAADDAAEAWKERAVNRLRQALRGYGMDAKLKGARLTPNAALIRLEGSDHLTVEMVEKRRTQLLTSHGLDVIGVRPAPGEIVVMVRREQRAILRLPALWARRRLPETAPLRNTSLLIGAREDDGELLYLNLAEPFAGQPQHGPHTLIAGETGSGKGVLTQNLLLDICATNAPESARIWLVDPKHGGDYPWIRRLPHLGRPIVTKQDEAIEALKALTEEMERRYEAITAVASNMDGYNRKVAPEARLPRLFFVHDELGDWMADKDRPDYREAVESYVVRLASKARAAGIHLILITQRPDKDALPGQIKANMNNKLCLRVSSKANSLIVLDEVGAELLLGQGHLAAKLANERPSMQSGYVLAQVPFATEEELDRMADLVADYWRGRASSG